MWGLDWSGVVWVWLAVAAVFLPAVFLVLWAVGRMARMSEPSQPAGPAAPPEDNAITSEEDEERLLTPVG